jgi:hypothetical protein
VREVLYLSSVLDDVVAGRQGITLLRGVVADPAAGVGRSRDRVATS